MTQIEQLKAEILKKAAVEITQNEKFFDYNETAKKIAEKALDIAFSAKEHPSEDLENATKDYLKVLALTPYNNTPITNTQVVCKELLVFLKEPCNYNPNKISAEPSEDLDFQVFAKEMDAVFNLPKEVTENTEEDPLNWEYAIARHFANWQKAQMEKQAAAALAKDGITTADLVAYNKGVAEGRRMEKEQFMEILNKWEEHAIRGMKKGATAYHQGKIALIPDLRDWLKKED